MWVLMIETGISFSLSVSLFFFNLVEIPPNGDLGLLGPVFSTVRGRLSFSAAPVGLHSDLLHFSKTTAHKS